MRPCLLPLTLLAGLVVCAAWESPAGAAADRRVTFRTDDGLQLVGTWHEPSDRPAPAVILVHMLDRSRRDWEAAASRLAAAGIGALALDLRGHGDSQFSPRPAEPGEFAALAADLTAARRYLAARSDVQPGHIGIAGASLGASLAVLAASESAAISSVALLSPSLDYRGLRIEAVARKVARPMLLVASVEDGYAMRTARDLQKAAGGPREVVTLHEAGHGTVMLGRDPSLVWTLVEWFRRTI